MKTLLLALPLVTLPLVSETASATPLRSQTGTYELQVLTDGAQAPTFQHQGETYVMGQRGQRYTLRIHNHSGRRIEAVVSVDGRDVVDGRTADYRTKRGYLVQPWGYVDVDGWRVSQGEAAAFRFSSVANSYVGRTGSTREVGVIRLAKEPGRMVTWLGVSTEEVSEALASQLGLKPGQGLVVVYVAPDSPAAKAGIQKYDVLEELGDQMLTGPDQLRKLVQMQKEGDSIQLTLHRAGKKQTVSATLGKRMESFSMGSGTGSPAWAQGIAFSGDKNFNWVQADQDSPMAVVHVDKKMINAEVQRNMEEARREIQDALRQSAQAGRLPHPMAPSAPGRPLLPPLPPLPPSVAIGEDANITVTKDGPSMKTVVKSDDSGILVIVANPKKHLTAHDPNGKLLFDGPIETPEQQQKVPPPMWEKVKPLLEQIKPEEGETPEPSGQSDDGQESETKMAAGVLVLL